MWIVSYTTPAVGRVGSARQGCPTRGGAEMQSLESEVKGLLSRGRPGENIEAAIKAVAKRVDEIDRLLGELTVRPEEGPPLR